MARTVHHISGGRVIPGIGAGWFERDYDEYGYEFGTGIMRLRALENAIPRIKVRLSKLNPPSLGPMPLLIGGSGEKVTLRIVAEQADTWNGFGPAEDYAKKNAVLTEWCRKVGRDPAAIERTVLIGPDEASDPDAFLQAGAQHLIVRLSALFDLAPVQTLLDARD